jgi:hypothetical protein
MRALYPEPPGAGRESPPACPISLRFSVRPLPPGCPIIAGRGLSLPAACQSVLLSLINEKISSQEADPSESELIGECLRRREVTEGKNRARPPLLLWLFLFTVVLEAAAAQAAVWQLGVPCASAACSRHQRLYLSAGRNHIARQQWQHSAGAEWR